MTTTTLARARELTDWFPADVKPVHIGVYETRRAGAPGTIIVYPAKWNGMEWLWDCESVAHAEKQHSVSEYQQREWRGLTEPA